MNIPPIRFRRFWCWLLTGHVWNKTGTSRPMGREMNTCVYCGLEEAGPD